MRIPILQLAAVALASSVLVVPAAAGQAAPAGETFTATASVKSDAITGTAPVRISIARFSTEAERASVFSAVKKGGTQAAKAVLAKMKDAGTIEVGERKAPIKYAYAQSTGSGRLVTVVAAVPLLHLGSGLPNAKPKAGHDLTVALLVLEADGQGHGELSPAAKVNTNDSGAIVVDDYGPAKIWLKGVAKAK